MTKYMKLLMVALFATLTFSLTACGDDDDEPGGSNNGQQMGQYTFNINGKTYYYGDDHLFAGMIKLTELAGFSLEPDYCLLVITAQDTPIKRDPDTGLTQQEQGETSDYDIQLVLDPFNPRALKKGDILTFRQTMTSTGDRSNYIWYYEPGFSFNNKKLFTWYGAPKGVVKFVSYDPDDEVGQERLTLEFVNLTLDMEENDYLDQFSDKSTQCVINGVVSFHAIP